MTDYTKPPRDIRDRVESFYRDNDGWWVILSPGWVVDGCVGVREDTKAKLWNRVREAVHGESE